MDLNSLTAFVYASSSFACDTVGANSSATAKAAVKIAHKRPRRVELPVRMSALSDRLRGLVCLQEGAHPVDGAGFQLRRLLPGKHCDLGIRRERGDIDGSLQW